MCVESALAHGWPLEAGRDALDVKCSVWGRRCETRMFLLSIASSVCFLVFKVSIEINSTQAPGLRSGQDKAH